MKLRIMLFAVAVSFAATAIGEVGYKFYGQVRTDLFYNSRSNSETVDGLFFMYPKDRAWGADGKDLNAKPDGNLYTMYTRLGVDLTAPKLGSKVDVSGKVEVDFRGSGTNYYMVRLRQAYFCFDFGASSLLVGQTWHPFDGDVAPELLNLNRGAPFQPFSRAPQIAYRYAERNFRMKLTALWQSQYLSVGPASNLTGETASEKSNRFIKNSCIPEIALNLDYAGENLIAGGGVDMTSLVPRTQSEYRGNVFKVKERITSFSAEAHLRYKNNGWTVAAKTVYGSNFTQASGVGGYGITDVDSRTGKQEYAPVRVSSTWVNVKYAEGAWQYGLFGGYLKNIGAATPVSGIIGTGVSDGLDSIVSGSAEVAYNLPHWQFGVEYLATSARYGSPDAKARMQASHGVVNHRVVFSALFKF